MQFLLFVGLEVEALSFIRFFRVISTSGIEIGLEYLRQNFSRVVGEPTVATTVDPHNIVRERALSRKESKFGQRGLQRATLHARLKPEVCGLSHRGKGLLFRIATREDSKARTPSDPLIAVQTSPKN